MDVRAALLVFLPVLLQSMLIGDERIPGVEQAVSMESLKRHVKGLHFGRNPDDPSRPLEKAGEYIHREFLRTGLMTWEEPFQWQGKTFRNIVAEKKGTATPEKIVILGAHYDSVEGSPGADDNASGIAVLLEAAKAVERLPLPSTIRFIAFNLEECGFLGSTHHAEKAKREGEQIRGMFSLECVGFTRSGQSYPSYLDPKFYPAVGDFITLIGNERSRSFVERVFQSFKTRVPGLPVEVLLVPGNGDTMEEARLSDHSPFWERGFPALMVTDTAFLRNPNYHLPTDTVDTLDFDFMRKVTLGILHSLMEVAK